MSDTVLLAIVGVFALVIKEYFDWQRAKEANKKIDIAVKNQNTKMNELTNQVEVIHKATNGLVVALGETKLAQGMAEGTAAGLQQGRAEHRDTGEHTAPNDRPTKLPGPDHPILPRPSGF